MDNSSHRKITGLFFNPVHALFWVILGLIIVIQNLTVGRLWRRKENHRWTLGYATVFGLSLPLVISGRWDLVTWSGLFVSVGISVFCFRRAQPQLAPPCT